MFRSGGITQMNKIKMSVTAALVSSLLSTSVFATGITRPEMADLPRPEFVVQPTNLPRDFSDSVVKLGFTLDEQGQPQNIKLLSPYNRELARALVPVIAQWRFKPAQEDGIAVTKQVILPLEITVKS